MNRILIEVGGNVSVFAVDAQGQCGGADLNKPGQSIHDAIRAHWGQPNLVLVRDVLFGTGLHAVTTYCGANGVGWTFRLHPFFSLAEEVSAHACRPVRKSGLAIAFDRLEAEYTATYGPVR